MNNKENSCRKGKIVKILNEKQEKKKCNPIYIPYLNLHECTHIPEFLHIIMDKKTHGTLLIGDNGQLKCII